MLTSNNKVLNYLTIDKIPYITIDMDKVSEGNAEIYKSLGMNISQQATSEQNVLYSPSLYIVQYADYTSEPNLYKLVALNDEKSNTSITSHKGSKFIYRKITPLDFETSPYVLGKKEGKGKFTFNNST